MPLQLHCALFGVWGFGHAVVLGVKKCVFGVGAMCPSNSADVGI